MTDTTLSAPGKQKRSALLLFLFSFLALMIGIVSNIKWGQASVSWQTLYEAVTFRGGDKEVNNS